MEIINRRKRISSLAGKLRREEKVVGFVPTMGALHDGHLTLVRKAKQICDVVIVSIFVNPTQFNEDADFEKYPRDITEDASLLAENNVDFVFAPDASEIYGENFGTYVTVDEISEKLEGASRPGHFRGVATVVTILFNAIKPDFAFFGQKDAQQVAVIKRLTQDLGFETEIEVIPTVREESGLAMSSRNERLTNDQRRSAAILYKALLEAQIAIEGGSRNSSKLTEIVQKEIEKEPEAKIDYIAIVDNETLEPIEKVGESTVLIALAVRFGEIRLIDNMVVEP